MADYSNSTIPFSVDKGKMVTDVRNTLGLSNTLDNNDVAKLCKNSKVNMFSLKKPVHHPALYHEDDPNWYKGEFFDYGISIPNIQLSGAETANWIYDKPRGGLASPYRLDDFIGYYHSAAKMTTISMPSVIWSNGEGATLYTTFRPSTDKSIGYDLLFINNRTRYLCCMIKKSNGQFRVKTAANPIGSASGDYDYVTIDKTLLTWLDQGIHKAIFFLSNEQIPAWTSAPASRILYYAGYSDATESNVKQFEVKQFIPTPDYSWAFSPSEIEYALTNEQFTIVVTALKQIDMSTRQIKGTYTTSSGVVKSVTLKSLIPTIEDNLVLSQGQSRTLNFTATIWTDSTGAGIRPPSTNERFTFMLNLTAPAKDGIGEVTFANGSCECYSKLKF